jgi:hypothetical protein
LIEQAAARVQRSGGDPNRILSLLQMNESQQNDTLNVFQQAALSVKERQAAELGERKFGLDEQRLGLEGRRVSAQERNVASQIAERSLTAGQKSEQFSIARETLDIRREEQKQRSLDRQLANETNQLKRDQLQDKISAAKSKSEQSKRDIKFQADSAIEGVQDIIDTTDLLLSGEGLESAAGVSSLFPTIPGAKAADFESQLKTLKSQAFLTSIEKMKGLGALGEKEGAQLVAAVGSLDLSMSDKQLRNEIGRIKNKFTKAKAKMQAKFGKPSGEGLTLESLSGEDLLNMSDDQLRQLLGN